MRRLLALLLALASPVFAEPLVFEGRIEASERAVLSSRLNGVVAERERELAAASERIGGHLMHIGQLSVAHDHLLGHNGQLSAELAAARAEVNRLSHQLFAVYASTSWRSTVGLRFGSRAVRRIVRGR